MTDGQLQANAVEASLGGGHAGELVLYQGSDVIGRYPIRARISYDAKGCGKVTLSESITVTATASMGSDRQVLYVSDLPLFNWSFHVGAGDGFRVTQD